MADFVHSIEKFAPKMENATIWLQQLERAIRLDALVEDELDILLIKLDLSIIKLIEKKGLTTCQEIKQFLKDNYDGTNSTKYSLRKLVTFKLNLESANAFESSLNELEKLMSTAQNSLGEKALEREIHTYILKSLAHNPTLLHATGYSLNNRSIEELKTEIITAYKLSNQDKNLHCSYCKKNNHTAENCRRKNGECLKCGANDHKLNECPQRNGSKNFPITGERVNKKSEFRSDGFCMSDWSSAVQRQEIKGVVEAILEELKTTIGYEDLGKEVLEELTLFASLSEKKRTAAVKDRLVEKLGLGRPVTGKNLDDDEKKLVDAEVVLRKKETASVIVKVIEEMPDYIGKIKMFKDVSEDIGP
uniref:CCHC-type domain-containing protein n=1 Tax=Strongyloides venezuelensis TaxID=75913 RepID=A0A0K0G3I6_STRVS